MCTASLGMGGGAAGGGGMGAASMGLQAFGAGMSTVGAFFGAKAQKAALRHQAVMADINASISDGNARNAIRAGTFEESRIKTRGTREKGNTIASISGSGVDLSSNTAIARLTGNDLITEVDANTIRGNALREAWGYRFEAGNSRRSADAYRASASSISPLMAGATSLINGASQVAQSWYTLNKEGAFGGSTSKTPSDPGSLLSNWTFTGAPVYRDGLRRGGY